MFLSGGVAFHLHRPDVHIFGIYQIQEKGDVILENVPYLCFERQTKTGSQGAQ